MNMSYSMYMSNVYTVCGTMLRYLLILQQSTIHYTAADCQASLLHRPAVPYDEILQSSKDPADEPECLTYDIRKPLNR